jgi:predicted nucleic acid-binding protein
VTDYLVDTSVISLTGPARRQVPADLARWISEQGAQGRLYIPTMVLAELERGIAKLHRMGGVARAAELRTWLDALVAVFAGKLIGIDERIARAAGKLDDALTAVGRNPGMADVLIGATADVHGLTLLTANDRHFADMPISVINPTHDALPN